MLVNPLLLKLQKKLNFSTSNVIFFYSTVYTVHSPKCCTVHTVCLKQTHLDEISDGKGKIHHDGIPHDIPHGEIPHSEIPHGENPLW